jgi:hypothetical protein
MIGFRGESSEKPCGFWLQQYLSRTAKSGNPKFPSSRSQTLSKIHISNPAFKNTVSLDLLSFGS